MARDFKPKRLLGLACLLVALSGCGVLPGAEAETKSKPSTAPTPTATPVDVRIARTGSLGEDIEYIGTTSPVRVVSLRSQVEGRLLELSVGVGDAVAQGQILARVDDVLLLTTLTQAQAELAARESEVARAKSQVASARTTVEETKLKFQQAQSDAVRLQLLYKEGAISAQEAELAQTAAGTAEQAVFSATEEVRSAQQAVAAAEGRVAAQRAAIAQAQERRSYARLTSPITGVVLERVTEPGNLVQGGGEVLKIGDFDRVKVEVKVSELELSKIQVGQRVRVRLDAFPGEPRDGVVTRISPQADPTSRQLPVEITIVNSDGRIGSGLLARCTFGVATVERVVVPQTALQEPGKQGGRGAGTPGGRGAGGAGTPGGRGAGGAGTPGGRGAGGQTTVFVVSGEGKEAKVAARAVTVGDRANGQVEILSGLKPGERYVSRSGKPLKDGETVRLSVLSETAKPQEKPSPR